MPRPEFFGLLKNRRTPRPKPNLPTTTYPDDVYLVLYPRSGNTWVRFMLANLFAKEEVTFQNIMHFVPSVHRDTEILNRIHRPRIIKSHAPFEPLYSRVIYLVRDGRDVYVSFYHYRQEQLPAGTTLADFIQMDHWPGSWGKHVISWLDANLPPDRFLLVRYEQIHEQPERELRRITEFIGLDVTEDHLKEAIRKSDLDAMRRIEDKCGHPRAGRFSGRFVRSGKTGGWKEHFGPPEWAAFKSPESENQALVRLGYESSVDW